MTPRISRTPAAAVVLAIGLVAPLGVLADTVKITLPASVTFAVTNVTNSTVGSPSSTTVNFNQFSTTGANVLRISVKADGDFVPPSGASIPASNLSWTTSNVSNGVATNGTLSTSAYSQVYESSLTKKAGGMDMTWTLAAPGTGIRAGAHRLTVRWKLESILP